MEGLLLYGESKGEAWGKRDAARGSILELWNMVSHPPMFPILPSPSGQGTFQVFILEGPGRFGSYPYIYRYSEMDHAGRPTVKPSYLASFVWDKEGN